MTIYVPYTYLIGWTRIDIRYYGVEYANSKSKIANPENLWKTYFTSSNYVEEYRKIYGEPDIIEIRHTFKTAKEALKWEDTVIRRMNAVKSLQWLNLCRGGKEFYNTGSEEIRLKMIELAMKRVENHTHNFQDKLWAKKRTATQIENHTHPWQGDGSFQRRVQQDRFNSGTHNFIEMDCRENALIRVENHTHNFQDKVWAKEKTKNLIEEGRHPCTIKKECEYCHKIFNIGNYVRLHGDRCKENPESTFSDKKECLHCHGLFSPGPLSKFHGDNCLLNPDESKRRSPIQLQKFSCEHCGIECSKSMYNRWHGDKCKIKIRMQ